MTVCRALDDLPSPFCEVVTRFFLQDQSYRTISEALGIASGTVASRVSRGLVMLREALEADPQATGSG
jgi:RNA polymerase sigma-70 factor (ECF subfamily)